MNDKGQVAIYAIMVGLVVIILALALAPSVSEFTETARNSSLSVVNGTDSVGLDCSNSSISNFDKATCVVTDLSMFYIIGSLILIGIAFIGAKIYFGA